MENVKVPHDFAIRARQDNLGEEHMPVVDRIRTVYQLLADGKSHTEVATIVGFNGPASVTAFTRSSAFREGLKWIGEKEGAKLPTTRDAQANAKVKEVLLEEAVKEGRQELAGCIPDVTRYVKECFQRDEKGKVRDDGLAQWASVFVGKSTGVGEPEQVIGQGGPVTINIGTVNAELHALDRDDTEAALQAKALDITSLQEAQADPVALPSPREGA